MNVTRRTVLATAPAGAALATLGGVEPVGAAGALIVPASPAASPANPAGWLVALRSGLAQRGAP